uniref:Uncharacterized protein n=1 Tax=Anguilla anguilla TaxID=7936 RepID=A0A0E9RVY6_ANGAN
MGQLAAQLFLCKLCVFASLVHEQESEQGSRFDSRCGICIWSLFGCLST